MTIPNKEDYVIFDQWVAKSDGIKGSPEIYLACEECGEKFQDNDKVYKISDPNDTIWDVCENCSKLFP
jgi:hypothetical protein